MASCGEERLGVNKRLATTPVKRRVCSNLLFWKVTLRGQASPLRLLFRERVPQPPGKPCTTGACRSCAKHGSFRCRTFSSPSRPNMFRRCF